MTATAQPTNQPDPAGEVEPLEAAPIIKQAAVSPTSKHDAQAAKLAVIAEAGKFRSTKGPLSGGAWVSGWCGAGESCRDGKVDPNSAKPRHRCLGVGENGAKVTPRYLFCACACHRTNPAAVPVPSDESDSDNE